jgi:ketosteroid isomerase-like protein
MTRTPTEVMMAILENPTDLEHVRSLVTDDVAYVSLNYEDADLKKIMPWCGRGSGAERIVKTFVDVGRFWQVQSFEIETKFDSGENVAIYGRFTYKSTVMGKTVTTPFVVLGKVREGRCSYMQFMEDTFATGASFRSGGAWTFRSDPDGGEVTI